MNFFKFYIGDYQRDTAHLSIAEHGAYALMLQHYYATEKPLPSGRLLHRMLRAQDKCERDAIDAVASQFWKETPEGLVNERADAEIRKAKAQAETNARISREREDRRKGVREQHKKSTIRSTVRALDGLGVSQKMAEKTEKKGEIQRKSGESSDHSNASFIRLGDDTPVTQQLIDFQRNREHESYSVRATNDARTEHKPDTIHGTIGQPNHSHSQTKEKPKTSRRADNARLPILDPQVEGLDLEAWRQFVEYRRGIGKSIKPPSVKAAQRRLVRLAQDGSSQTAIVAQSVENGWQGLFALKQEATQGVRPRMDNRTYGPGGKI